MWQSTKDWLKIIFMLAIVVAIIGGGILWEIGKIVAVWKYIFS